MRLKKRRILTLGLLAGLLLVLAAGILLMSGCGSESASASQMIFSYAETAEPPSLDPAQVGDSAGMNITSYIYDGLVKYDPQSGEVKPGIAESWDVSDDGMLITFHLKHGSKFSNGQDVGAEDFVYAWTRALQPDTASRTSQALMVIKGASDVASGKSQTVAGLEAPDMHTLKVTLEQPYADFPALAGQAFCMPVPKDEVEKAGGAFGQNPVGNGPFKIKEWRHNDAIVLEPNDQYNGEKPQLTQVTVKIIPTPATAVAELKAGNVDAIRLIDPGQMSQLQNDNSVKIYEGPGNAIDYIGFNTTQSPFDKPEFRRAISSAVDRQTLAGKVLQGMAEPADGLVPPYVFGRTPGQLTDTFDAARVASLLNDAGYPNGEGLPSMTLLYSQNSADEAQALQAQLKNVGIKIEIQGMDPQALQAQVQAGQASMFILPWQDVPLMDRYITQLFGGQQAGGMGVFGYGNPQVDDILMQAAATGDTSQRMALYGNAEKAILADMPAVPLVFYKNIVAYSPNVSNFVYTPLGMFALDQITTSAK